MDDQGFDRFTRAFSSNASRRQVAAMLSALAVSAVHVPNARGAQSATPAPTCAEGQANCAGACVDTCCDNGNCGTCGNACAEGFTCFEGVCDCPSGTCGPQTPPNTGSGTKNETGGSVPWLAAALASGLAAAFAVRLGRERSTTDRR